MSTAYDTWRQRHRGPEPEEVHHYLCPLDEIFGVPVLPGQQIQFLSGEYWRITFTIIKMVEIRRQVEEQEFPYFDYDLQGKDQYGYEYNLTLRFIPLEDTLPGARVHYQALLLHLFDDHAYNDQVALDLEQNNLFILEDIDPDKSKLINRTITNRVDEVSLPYACYIYTVASLDNPQTEIPPESWEIWDFLEITTENGFISQEYFFVEAPDLGGHFYFYRGFEISVQTLKLIR